MSRITGGFLLTSGRVWTRTPSPSDAWEGSVAGPYATSPERRAASPAGGLVDGYVREAPGVELGLPVPQISLAGLVIIRIHPAVRKRRPWRRAGCTRATGAARRAGRVCARATRRGGPPDRRRPRGVGAGRLRERAKVARTRNSPSENSRSPGRSGTSRPSCTINWIRHPTTILMAMAARAAPPCGAATPRPCSRT